MPQAALRRFGVPVGGAFDSESLALASALAGPDSGETSWELSMAQASFRAKRARVVTVVGAIAVVRLRGESLETSTAFSVTEGDEFLVEVPSDGARVYVAYGSSARQVNWRLRLEEPPESVANRRVLRVVAGPQASSFLDFVLETEFTVSRIGNRVGVRLEPPIGAHRIELPSEPQCVGTIQVSNDGTPILLGPDGPTIGGYPKIAVVATCDLPRIGQLAPGDAVRFEIVSIEDARQLLQEAKLRLERRLRLLKLSTTL